MAWVLTSNNFDVILAHTLGSLVDTSYDHGAMGGLTDDDHTIYLLADGTRNLTGSLDSTGQYIKITNAVDPYFEAVDNTNTVTARMTAKDTYVRLGAESAHSLYLMSFGAANLILGDGTISGPVIKDEDNMASNSATHLCTQQSIVAYIQSTEWYAYFSFEHHDLSGLADDDHTQYLLIDGTRLMTGAIIAPGGVFNGWVIPDTGYGPHVEVLFTGGIGYVQAYDRDYSTWEAIKLYGADVTIASQTGSIVLNTAVGISGTAIKDEDNMASDSAVHLCSQQSIKAYADSVGSVIQDSGWTGILKTSDGTPTLQETFDIVDATGTGVIEQAAEPDATSYYAGMIWIDTDATPANPEGWTYIDGGSQAGTTAYIVQIGTNYTQVRILGNVIRPSVNNCPTMLQISSVGTTWLTAAYEGRYRLFGVAGAAVTTCFRAFAPSYHDTGATGYLIFNLFKDTTVNARVWFSGDYWTNSYYGQGSGFISSAGAIQYIKLSGILSSTYTTGKFYVMAR